MNDLVIGPTAASALAACRAAAGPWRDTPVADRLRVVRAARRLLAARGPALAATVARPAADTLVAELLPLLEAARFLERRAAGLLAPRRQRRGRPLWLWGVRAEVRRVPLGAVLVLAPGNYPLFLPAVQALQALVAGNVVCLKPAPEGVAAADAVAAVLAEAGLPPGLLQVLPPDAGPAAVAAGFDHIVLTGSAETGARVLAAAGLTPCTMELSGADAVFVLPGADPALVARCLAYGLRLNGGATCIAPRRVFVPRNQVAALEAALLPLLPAVPDAHPPAPVLARLRTLAAEAVEAGATLHWPGPARPAVLCGTPATAAILGHDIFAPWLALVPVEDAAHALRLDAGSPYALGASVFGPAAAAEAFAARLRPGSVCVNDLIVPTADPRLPFGGTGRSGFGATRGAEGLLAMTRPQAVSVRRGRFRPHLAPATPKDAARFAGMALLLHGGWRQWGRALAAMR